MIDVFDSKGRMRQGTFNLFLWKNKKLDMSLDCTTPGLFYDLPESLCGFGLSENEGVEELSEENGFKKNRENFKKIN